MATGNTWRTPRDCAENGRLPMTNRSARRYSAIPLTASITRGRPDRTAYLHTYGCNPYRYSIPEATIIPDRAADRSSGNTGSQRSDGKSVGDRRSRYYSRYEPPSKSRAGTDRTDRSFIARTISAKFDTVAVAVASARETFPPVSSQPSRSASTDASRLQRRYRFVETVWRPDCPAMSNPSRLCFRACLNSCSARQQSVALQNRPRLTRLESPLAEPGVSHDALLRSARRSPHVRYPIYRLPC